MKISCILKAVFLFSILSCKSTSGEIRPAVGNVKKAAQDTVIEERKKPILSGYDAFGNTEIICDGIYKNKNYKILISSFSEEKSYFEGDYNSVFQLLEFKIDDYHEIYRDSIQRHFDEILFEDFTNDGVPDILVQNISDVRSNVTYYLYKIDTAINKVTKIKDFETIKNSRFLPKYNLIDNQVMSGRNWTSFYEIIDDQVKDYGFIIEDGEDENGIYSYDRDYTKALQQVLKERKK